LSFLFPLYAPIHSGRLIVTSCGTGGISSVTVLSSICAGYLEGTQPKVGKPFSAFPSPLTASPSPLTAFPSPLTASCLTCSSDPLPHPGVQLRGRGPRPGYDLCPRR
jgi:hypothetical protein